MVTQIWSPFPPSEAILRYGGEIRIGYIITILHCTNSEALEGVSIEWHWNDVAEHTACLDSPTPTNHASLAPCWFWFALPSETETP